MRLLGWLLLFGTEVLMTRLVLFVVEQMFGGATAVVLAILLVVGCCIVDVEMDERNE